MPFPFHTSRILDKKFKIRMKCKAKNIKSTDKLIKGFPTILKCVYFDAKNFLHIIRFEMS